MPRSSLGRGLLLAALAAGLALVWLLGGDRLLADDLMYLKTGPIGHAWQFMAYWLGHGGVQAGAMGFLLLLGLAVRKLDLTPTALAGLLSLAAGGLLVQIVKHLVGRPRPGRNMLAWDLQGLSFDSDLHSFPSGHATTTFALAAVLAARFPRWSWAFYLAALFISLGRVVGGSHFVSDVLVGAMLGLVVGWLLAWRCKVGVGGR
ncbi:phosphatase PAP2 family protein [Desulfarculus baarsii]